MRPRIVERPTIGWISRGGCCADADVETQTKNTPTRPALTRDIGALSMPNVFHLQTRDQFCARRYYTRLHAVAFPYETLPGTWPTAVPPRSSFCYNLRVTMTDTVEASRALSHFWP